MKVNGFHINVDELAELLHISIEEYRHRFKKDRLTIRQILAISKYVGFSLEETMDYFFADFDAKRYNLSRKIIREGKKNAKA
nr:MAG TPA: Regulatory protein-modification, helix-turn-helix, transcriptional regulato, DNA [Caudoviricetes sp.]DAK28420.1 MAG TPA: Regulatory protein-modification, helix-turn-helix, transcriptional regulato, DNA [Caudoviricetes sp.]